MKSAAAILALAMLGAHAIAHHADAADIRVYSSGAPSVAAKAIAASFATETGHQLTFTVAQPSKIQQRLGDGEHPDVVILPSRAVERLNQLQLFSAGSAVDLARVGVGVVVRAGAPRPDISNDAAIQKLLTDAHSIVYPDPSTGGGFAGRAIARMIEQMGLSDTVKPKLTLKAAISGGVNLVADGKADVGFFNISEILPIAGVTLVGPLPEDLQNYIVFTAAIPATNADPGPAASFIKSLSAPAAKQAWRNAGMEPL
jgi:molybdate transport system substrate-binding protein